MNLFFCILEFLIAGQVLGYGIDLLFTFGVPMILCVTFITKGASWLLHAITNFYRRQFDPQMESTSTKIAMGISVALNLTVSLLFVLILAGVGIPATFVIGPIGLIIFAVAAGLSLFRAIHDLWYIGPELWEKTCEYAEIAWEAICDFCSSAWLTIKGWFGAENKLGSGVDDEARLNDPRIQTGVPVRSEISKASTQEVDQHAQNDSEYVSIKQSFIEAGQKAKEFLATIKDKFTEVLDIFRHSPSEEDRERAKVIEARHEELIKQGPNQDTFMNILTLEPMTNPISPCLLQHGHDGSHSLQLNRADERNLTNKGNQNYIYAKHQDGESNTDNKLLLTDANQVVYDEGTYKTLLFENKLSDYDFNSSDTIQKVKTRPDGNPVYNASGVPEMVCENISNRFTKVPSGPMTNKSLYLFLNDDGVQVYRICGGTVPAKTKLDETLKLEKQVTEEAERILETNYALGA